MSEVTKSSKLNNVVQESIPCREVSIPNPSEIVDDKDSDSEYEWRKVRRVRRNGVGAAADPVKKEKGLSDLEIIDSIDMSSVNEIEGGCLKENESVGRPLNFRF